MVIINIQIIHIIYYTKLNLMILIVFIIKDELCNVYLIQTNFNKVNCI